MRRAVGLVVLALTAVACGTATEAAPPTPAERHLVYQTVEDDRIWIADVDGANPRPLGVSGHGPTISPNGKLVTYTGRCVAGDTSACETRYVVSTSGDDTPHRLSIDTGPVVWTPDSERIVASSRFNIVSIEVSTGTASEVAVGRFSGWSLSPDGTQIVYSRAGKRDATSMTGFAVDLFVSDIDGGEAKQLTDSGDAVEPVWGPKSIAFSKLIPCPGYTSAPIEGCKNHTWGRHELWAVQPDGTGLRPISAPLPDRFQMSGCVGMRPVDWSENGATLLAAWDCEFSADPVVVDVADGQMRQLGGGIAISLSDDGRFALVDGTAGAEPRPETQRVFVYSLPGGNPGVVALRASDPTWNR